MTPALYSHQKSFVEKAPNKYGMFHATGTGKTITALTIVSKYTYSCLVIAPKGVKSKWQEVTRDYPSCVFFIITKEEFRRDWNTIPKFESVVIDEFHHFSSIKSQLHKSLIKYLKKYSVKYVWGLTATPYRREPMNIFALARILGHNWNYINFRHKFYYEQRFGMRVVWLPKKNIEKEVAELVRKIGDVVAYEEVAESPPITHIMEYIEQTASQKRAMKELELIEANPLTFYMREHQIMSGVGAKSGKDERLLELAEQTPKMAIFARYTSQIDTYKVLFPEAEVIDGRTKDKDSTAKRFEAMTNGIIIIQADSAEGFELGSVHTIVFASKSYSFLSYTQALGRFIRINNEPKPKRFFHLLTRKTIDEEVEKNIQAKKDFDVEIYARKTPL